MTATSTAFRLPVSLLEAGYALRPEKDSDTPFLIAIFATTRERELAYATMWTEAQKQAFVAQQFAAQRQDYRTTIDGCTFEVIERGGVPIGRLYLQERVANLHIVDILLAPAVRGAGLGTALLEGLIAAAGTRGKGVGIFVEKDNPASRLYERMGFVTVADFDFHYEMERRASGRCDQLKIAS